jgi:hypothetical protein
MTDIEDDSESFTIALTESGEPEPSETPWALLGAALIGLYLYLKRR